MNPIFAILALSLFMFFLSPTDMEYLEHPLKKFVVAAAVLLFIFAAL
jgi:hypothetical protein